MEKINKMNEDSDDDDGAVVIVRKKKGVRVIVDSESDDSDGDTCMSQMTVDESVITIN